MAKKKKNTKKLIGDDGLIATQALAAEYAGVSVKTVYNWKTARMAMSGRKYIPAVLDQYKVSDGSGAFDAKGRQQAADANYKEIKAKLLQMELDVKEGRLLDAEEVKAGQVRRVQVVKRVLMGIGRKYAKRFAGIKTPAKIQKIIDDEMRNIINGFAGE